MNSKTLSGCAKQEGDIHFFWIPLFDSLTGEIIFLQRNRGSALHLYAFDSQGTSINNIDVVNEELLPVRLSLESFFAECGYRDGMKSGVLVVDNSEDAGLYEIRMAGKQGAFLLNPMYTVGNRCGLIIPKEFESGNKTIVAILNLGAREARVSVSVLTGNRCPEVETLVEANSCISLCIEEEFASLVQDLGGRGFSYIRIRPKCDCAIGVQALYLSEFSNVIDSKILL